jgi:hypothetical protein
MSAQATPAAKSARRAVTLIEAVLFISIALALIVGGLVFYRQATIARQTQETVRLVQAIVAESRVMWRQSGSFSYDTSDPNALGRVLHAAGALPSNAWDEASGTVRSPWGGTILIGRSDPDSALPGTLIWVTFLDDPPIPREVCSRIVMFDGSTTSGALGNGVAFVDMNVFSAYGSAAYAPSDKYIAANPGTAAAVSHWGGLSPATAGEACERFDFQSTLVPANSGLAKVKIGFWFRS